MALIDTLLTRCILICSLLILLPISALASKCPSPPSASYPDLINSGEFLPFYLPLASSGSSSSQQLFHIHFFTGNAAFSKQSYAVAEACYARACSLDPKQPLALSNLALAVMNQGRDDEALKVHNRIRAHTTFTKLFSLVKSTANSRLHPPTGCSFSTRLLSWMSNQLKLITRWAACCTKWVTSAEITAATALKMILMNNDVATVIFQRVNHH
jgi:tetratricopeptide (TPR) repeat protein